MSKDISRQLEEIDEKSTIIMAGAEKVKQLLENMKERANNFAFETEMMWRKIEKAEKELENESEM